MGEDIFNKLKTFIIKQVAIPENKEINRCTKIQDDLGIYGDDAVEFLISFSKEFNVDISSFMAADYFSSEGDMVLPAIIRFLINKKKKKRKLITIGHLEKAILEGKLNENIFR